ncbi:transmembrane protein 106B-like isoform X2 [Lineus longissimus]|uniref:transmembrane protein 106B-like isoform X2 n=1 Tax=Lineus longissimus TaxID=88925 RepID=UPI00315CB1B3
MYGSIKGREMQQPLISSENNHDGYEELMKGSVHCPTCRGTGRVPKEQEAKLIALIPVTDMRLNPQIKSKVAVAVIACIVIAALTIFFLIPRSVSLSTSGFKIKPEYALVNTSGKGLVILHFTNSFNVTNDNFYPVTVSTARMTAMHDDKKQATATNSSELNIPLRSTSLHYIKMNITFDFDEGYVAGFCVKNNWSSQIVMEFDISINSTYLGHTEQDTITTYQHVNCSATSPKRRRRSAVSQMLGELGLFQ